MKFKTGLVSISFRALSAEQIIEIAKNAGLEDIEWGGDVHVPAGDVEKAARVREKCLSAGLKIPEYGSYYRLGVSDTSVVAGVVESARALGTDTVRVWAYNKGSHEISADEYKKIVEETRKICAEYSEVCFCTECHNNTLTDDYKANLKLISDVNMPNFKTFWQPNQLKTHLYNLESLRALAPYIRAIHVFAWEGSERYPLSRHRHRWIEYLSTLAQCCDSDNEIALMLEFMHDDMPSSLKVTAEELNSILSAVER